jgi:hypothetical protein
MAPRRPTRPGHAARPPPGRAASSSRPAPVSARRRGRPATNRRTLPALRAPPALRDLQAPLSRQVRLPAGGWADLGWVAARVARACRLQAAGCRLQARPRRCRHRYSRVTPARQGATAAQNSRRGARAAFGGGRRLGAAGLERASDRCFVPGGALVPGWHRTWASRGVAAPVLWSCTFAALAARNRAARRTGRCPDGKDEWNAWSSAASGTGSEGSSKRPARELVDARGSGTNTEPRLGR